MTDQARLEAHWASRKEDLALLNLQLAGLIRADAASQDLLDVYLEMKRAGADAFQALLRSTLPNHETEWVSFRGQLDYEAMRRYGDELPSWALQIPYASSVHKELFYLLVDRLGAPVPADYLRIITADAVHAERRVRELRELGLPVAPVTALGTDAYQLESLNVDKSFIAKLVLNTIKAKKLPRLEEQKLVHLLQATD